MSPAMEFTTVESGGRKFVFSDAVDGPPVVLFHGFPRHPFGLGADGEAAQRRGLPHDSRSCAVITPTRSSPAAATAALRSAPTRSPCSTRSVSSKPLSSATGLGAGVVYRAAALAAERLRGLSRGGDPTPAQDRALAGLLWRARHSSRRRLWIRLASRDDFAYLGLVRRWAPRWSGAEREATLAAVKRRFADPVVLRGALGYYRVRGPEVSPATWACPR